LFQVPVRNPLLGKFGDTAQIPDIYRVNDWFSIGSGVGLVYGAMEMEVAVPRQLGR
jgi:hypothetical protein